MLISMQNHNEMAKEKPEPENGQNKSDAEAAFFIYLFLFFFLILASSSCCAYLIDKVSSMKRQAKRGDTAAVYTRGSFN